MATESAQDAMLTTYEGPLQEKEDFPEHEQWKQGIGKQEQRRKEVQNFLAKRKKKIQ